MPQISVIVPVYKVEPYLLRCVDSILYQTFKDFELILVDDGSSDGCPAICDRYAENYSCVHVIHQKNGGPSAARNAGIDWSFANSDSQWIYFADSDDWIHPESLEFLMHGAEETKSDVIIGGYENTEGESPVVDTEQIEAIKWNTETFFCNHNTNAVVAWGKLYRKECFKEIRYPAGKIHEDEFVTYKILFEHDEITFINQPLYAYFQNPGGITGVGWKPERLLLAEAFDERVKYFIEKNNSRMVHWSLQSMFGNLRWNINNIRKSDYHIRKKYEKQTLRFYKEKIEEYRVYLSLENDRKVFLFINPIMKIYFIVNRVFGLGLNETISKVREKWKDRL